MCFVYVFCGVRAFKEGKRKKREKQFLNDCGGGEEKAARGRWDESTSERVKFNFFWIE
jgi:hypothetical protein